ncbi:MAG: hypothetical protein J7K22_02445 [Nanoarchaeota archaeon]|nr:hypothetical protein [Nanoarchaeota archaeon]
MRGIMNKNNITRYKILEFLYLKNQESKTVNSQEVTSIGFSKEEVSTNLKFLKDEGLVDYISTFGSFPFVGIKITSKGIRLIEEIYLSKKNKKNISNWIKVNASWMIPSLIEIIKLVI